jgi:tripartite-type tricarboxylate transporter receptor subunit TctC
MMRIFVFVVALGAGFVAALGAQAQDAAAFYRGKTISLIVGTGAGGGFDADARLLAPGIERATGARVVVDNRSGAGGLIALNAAMAAPADGLTLILVNGPAAVAAQLLHQEAVRFDLTKFGWIGGLAREPWILVARRGLTVASLPTAGSGDVVRWGASGKTDSQAVSAATLSEALGLRSRIIVGYKGSAEVGTSVLRGETDAMVLPAARTAPPCAIPIWSRWPLWRASAARTCPTCRRYSRSGGFPRTRHGGSTSTPSLPIPDASWPWRRARPRIA